ncbi:HAMP domain-containing sensor histidine kinase [Pseudonocardia petroleophila]|uniref:histidine kinase n=1 Tax=Pseudonocardia petroleophila TaxID=37331 RepID=A0A7G7MFP9_9PSEU|nr:HAMP domain-containing sensor histidine kinase [Pseudonocardia petroleophila]QNG51610.1 HAMP domain-containing histidine kinase [Pseudonocardia petroleophila]
MTRLSLRWRVALAFGLGALLFTGVFATATWNLASGYMLRQRETSASLQAELNVRLVEASLRSGSEGLDDLLTGLSTDSESTVLLRRPEGWITSGRQVDPERLPTALRELARRGTPALQRLMVDRVPVLAVTHPVTSAGTAYVELFPLSQLDRTFRFISTVLAAGVALSALLGVALGSWASRRALRPLTELTAAASRVAGGDVRARLPEQGDPDLAPLAVTFNRTAEALENRVRRDARFAADVSHELRSPLTTMANAAEVLVRRRGEISGVAGRALDLLLGETGRFQRMVVDLLEISGDRDDGPSESVDLVDLVDLVDHVVGVRASARPVVESADPAPIVQGDRRRLDRVVANLLDNADRYGGGPVRVAVLRRGGQARVEVDDAGPGVAEQYREVVFERFARGAEAGRRGGDGGSGLGLALVAQHVRYHGGAVWVEDRPGGGARFVVELPEAPR